jgi:hypothetical protein
MRTLDTTFLYPRDWKDCLHGWGNLPTSGRTLPRCFDDTKLDKILNAKNSRDAVTLVSLDERCPLMQFGSTAYE